MKESPAARYHSLVDDPGIDKVRYLSCIKVIQCPFPIGLWLSGTCRRAIEAGVCRYDRDVISGFKQESTLL